MKTVKLIDLIKLLYGVVNLFEAQDEDCPNGRAVAARERAVGHYLRKITSSAEEQRKIREAAEHSLGAFETLEKQLRELGYEIEEEQK